MNRVITVNLNGNAYSIEEPGYEALCAYLSHADAQLRDNPDRGEITSDLEQAIAEKCAGCLNPRKTVVTAPEMDTILQQMGPVSDTTREEKSRGSTGATTGAFRRIYKIRDGAMLGGVCTGLAAYFDKDVVLLRILFCAITLFTGGAGIGVYLIMTFIIPYAETSEEHAAAYGMPFNAQEFIHQAKESYADLKENGWKLKSRVKEESREWQNAWRRTFRKSNAAPAPGPGRMQPMAAVAVGVTAILMGIVALVWVVAFVSLVNSERVFGMDLPRDMPLWVGLLLLIALYNIISIPLKAMAHNAFEHAYGRQGSSTLAAWSAFLWMGVMTFAVWFAYSNVPEIHDFLLRLFQNVERTLN